MIAMESLSLIPLSQALKRAFIQSRDALGHALGLRLLDGWPEFPEALEPRSPDPAPPWCGYLFASGDEVVGNGGFVGPPDADGCVEIGYEIAPARWNRGYATAAARRLLELAWANGATRVLAHSAPDWNGSNRVMGKVGMRFVEAVPNAELGTVWRYAINRSDPDLGGVLGAG